MLEASGDNVPAVGAKGEEMIARVRNWLAD